MFDCGTSYADSIATANIIYLTVQCYPFVDDDEIRDPIDVRLTVICFVNDGIRDPIDVLLTVTFDDLILGFVTTIDIIVSHSE